MTEAYLLDTNVISETRRSRAAPNVLAFLARQPAEALFLSALTMGELRRGAALRRAADPAAATALAIWIDGIETIFSDRIVPVDGAVARAWGELGTKRTLPVIDALIAATALARGLTLVTRNMRDMTQIGAPMLNPWDLSSPPR